MLTLPLTYEYGDKYERTYLVIQKWQGFWIGWGRKEGDIGGDMEKLNKKGWQVKKRAIEDFTLEGVCVFYICKNYVHI